MKLNLHLLLLNNFVIKGTIHVRLTALPNLPEICRTSLPLCSDVGQFMCINGTVIRRTAPKVLEYRKLWKCKKCRHQFTIDAEVEKSYIFEKPIVCPNPEWCSGKNFTLLSTDVDPQHCKDYCEIKIQQQFNTLTVGSVPRSMWVILEDDLVDSCHPGNDVNVSGILIQRWKPLSRENFINIDLVLYAHNVEVKNKNISGVVSESLALEFEKFWLENQSDPLKGRDFILSSICPQVFGLYIVKLAVALTLAGGVEKKDENSRIRGDSHLLLVGDPGTGKSQFLKFASKICMRTVLTSGIGTTNAGLTVSAVKESGKWQLEAGALVLADGGLCCIDEFSCIKEQDKTCIHEAMEQQTISVAKAGLVCSLSTKCSIFAATNPKGKYDENLSLSENTALASPLLSRFDIILVLLDTYDEKWDKMVSGYILEGQNFVDIDTKLSFSFLVAQTPKKSFWSLSKMRSYFNMIRYINPKMNPSCEKVLQTYYRRQRGLEGRNFARTTPRLLQSLIRLAEGHARLMFRDEVLIIDAVIAIILMESSMSGSAVLDGLTTLHTSFPEDPISEYNMKAKTVLELLELEDLLTDSLNYGFSYQDLCLKKLLSEVSFTCKSNKSNSYLYDKNDVSQSSHSSNVSSDFSTTNKHSEFSDVSYSLDRFLLNQNTKTSNDVNNFSISQSTENVHDFKEILNSSLNHESTRIQNNNVHQEQNMATTINEENVKGNEISTLSDLRNMFPDDLFQLTDKSNSFRNLFKRKQNDKSLTVNVKDPQTSSYFNQENPPKKLKNSTFDAAELSKNTALKENACSTTRIDSAKPLKSLKQFSFQKTNKKDNNPLINTDKHNLENFILTSEQSKIKDAIFAKENSEHTVCIDTVLKQSEVNNSALDSKSILNLIVPTSQTDQRNILKSEELKNEVEKETRSEKKPKWGNFFEKFKFTGKSKSTNSKNADQCVSSTESEVNLEQHRNAKSTTTTGILSSQMAFKRIFSSSVKESTLDLDDPFFKM
ncbi:UNVERIFIED_CONTAM: DNA helicase [Trichonephila clavipes]